MANTDVPELKTLHLLGVQFGCCEVCSCTRARAFWEVAVLSCDASVVAGIQMDFLSSYGKWSPLQASCGLRADFADPAGPRYHEVWNHLAILGIHIGR